MLLLSSFLFTIIFNSVLFADEVVLDFGIKPFDICNDNPLLWTYIKRIYVVTFIFCNIIINNYIYIPFEKKHLYKKSKQSFSEYKKDSSIKLLIGYDKNLQRDIYVPEQGLYQNILITGTIGTGKTSSAMYPFTRQLIKYNSCNKSRKIGMLILDVKGNYYKQVKEYTSKYCLNNDLIVLELQSNIKYNPLHKPRFKSTNFSK